MERNTFLKQFEEQIVMLDEEGVLSFDVELEGIEEWDSLAKVAFLAYADRELGVHISAVDIKNCNTIEDLFQIISN